MHHYVYRITNIKEHKYYYGSRTIKNTELSAIEDLINYRSSADKWFKDDQLINPTHYKYKILKLFYSRPNALIFESFLHNKFDVKNHASFYNKANQTSTGFNTTGCISVTDGTTNYLVSKTDSRYLDGTLISCTKGKAVVKDKDGNRFQVGVNDPRYLSGELVHQNKGDGRFAVHDNDGLRYFISKEDSRYLSGELVAYTKGKAVVKDKEGKRFQIDVNDPRYLSGELAHININKAVVKDKDGNRFQVDVNDPRYLSGELVGMNKDSKRPDRCKKVNIYDTDNNLIVATVGNFKEKCLILQLPFIALKNSYLKGGIPIYLNPKSNLKKLVSCGDIQYKGWYAIIV